MQLTDQVPKQSNLLDTFWTNIYMYFILVDVCQVDYLGLYWETDSWWLLQRAKAIKLLITTASLSQDYTTVPTCTVDDQHEETSELIFS